VCETWAGLRAAEACGLETTDCTEIVGGGLELHIRHGKGDKPRFVWLDEKGAAYLRPLLRQPAGPLLRTGRGKPLHTNQVRRTVYRLAGSAGIKTRVHPHALRHTFARSMYDAGKGLRELQEALGHTSLATTEIYLRSIGCSETSKAMMDREW